MFSRAVTSLVVAALALPVLISVLAAVSRLLAAMGDAVGGMVLDRLALAGGILWVVVLICLVLMLGIQSLVRDQLPPEE